MVAINNGAIASFSKKLGLPPNINHPIISRGIVAAPPVSKMNHAEKNRKFLGGFFRLLALLGRPKFMKLEVTQQGAT